MIFGKPRKQMIEEEQSRLMHQFTNGIQRYAWFPVRLDDGTTVWCEEYWAYPDLGIGDNGEYFIWTTRSSPIYHKYLHRQTARSRQLPVKRPENKRKCSPL